MEEKPTPTYVSVYVAVFFTVLLALMVEKNINKIVAKIYDLVATWWTRRTTKVEVKAEDTTLERPIRPVGLPGTKRKASDDGSSVEDMDVDQSHMDVDDSGGATKDELLRRLADREEHIRELRRNFETSENEYAKSLLQEIDLKDKNEENLDKYEWAMNSHSRAVDSIRALENQLKQKETDTRLTATRFGNLQTKYNEKEKELTKLQERYDNLCGLHAGPLAQNAMRDLRSQIDEKNKEILEKLADTEALRSELATLQGNLRETDRLLQDRNRLLQEKNQQIENLTEHNRELQRSLTTAKAPETVTIATGASGSCYHLPGCSHVHSGGKSYRKCKSCLP